MRQILYISVAAPDFRPRMLGAILDSAERNNRANGITGLLCYLEGGFIQVLEGPHEAVQRTFDKVSCDHRHLSVTVLIDREVGGRSFPEWRMGFRTLSDADAAMRPAFRLSRAALADQLPRGGAEDLLRNFAIFYDAHSRRVA